MTTIAAAFSVSVYQIFSVNNHLEEAIAGNQALEVEKAMLEYELQHVDSPEYIEQQARTMLKMIKPGEIFYVVPTGNEEQ
jgi:cell division protein FtsB